LLGYESQSLSSFGSGTDSALAILHCNVGHDRHIVLGIVVLIAFVVTAASVPTLPYAALAPRRGCPKHASALDFRRHCPLTYPANQGVLSLCLVLPRRAGAVKAARFRTSFVQLRAFGVRPDSL
jgi:hypothetical protein